MSMPISKKFNLFKALRWVLLVVIFVNNSSLLSHAATETNTNASLIIVATTNSLIAPNFVITPRTIEEGQNLIFTIEPTRFTDNSPATGLVCRFNLTAPDGSLVVLTGITNATGCIYDLSQPPTSQNLVLVSGNPTLLNTTIGAGSGFGQVISGSDVAISNIDNYTVTAKTLILSPFVINPKTINILEDQTFSLGQTKFNDGLIASNIDAVMTINTPNGQQVKLSGKTNNQGQFILNTALALNNQAVLNSINVNASTFSLISGNLNNISNTSGAGSGFVTLNYKGTNYISNIDNYTVRPPILVIPPVIQPIIDPIIQIIVRTGGAPTWIFGILLALVSFLFVQSTLSKKK
jgi:hypothetical protein